MIGREHGFWPVLNVTALPILARHIPVPTLPLLTLPDRRGLNKAALALLLAITVAGCAGTDGEPPMATYTPESVAPAGPEAAFGIIRDEIERTSRCLKTAEARPDYQILATKTPSADRADDRRPYSDPSRASREEAQKLQQFMRDIIECRPKLEGQTDGPFGRAVRTIITVWDDQQALYTHLQFGELTWGEFNRASRDNGQRLGQTLAMLRNQAPATVTTAAVAPQANGRMAGGSGAEPGAAVSAMGAPRSAPPRPGFGSGGNGGSGGSGAYLLHLASYKSEAAARRGWEQLSRQAQGRLEGMSPVIREVDIPGRGHFVRVMAGPVSSAADGRERCQPLRAAGLYCAVMADAPGAG